MPIVRLRTAAAVFAVGKAPRLPSQMESRRIRQQHAVGATRVGLVARTAGPVPVIVQATPAPEPSPHNTPVVLAIGPLPGGPWAPVAPSGPCGPVAPVGPLFPDGPIGPVGPAGPCAPVEPVVITPSRVLLAVGVKVIALIVAAVQPTTTASPVMWSISWTKTFLVPRLCDRCRHATVTAAMKRCKGLYLYRRWLTHCVL
jgi:hypothetical protein